jgi:anti-sigma factor RsiW
MSTPHLDDERAQRHLDGLLPAPERARVEEHLAGCPECRAVVEGCCAIAAALSGLPPPAPPEDFTDRVMTRIDDRERRVARERRTAAIVLASAAAAAVALTLAAGPAAWAPVLSRVGDLTGAAATWLRIGADVAEPLLRALRLEIAAATAGAAIPLLYAVRRLSAHGTETAS